jgi:hypothetical protein
MNLRLLPCDEHNGYAVLRDGSPYLIGQAPEFPFHVSCYYGGKGGCAGGGEHRTILDAVRYNQLPEVTPQDLEDMENQHPGLLSAYAAHLTLGHVLKIEHARDLFKAGFETADELEALARKT